MIRRHILRLAAGIGAAAFPLHCAFADSNAASWSYGGADGPDAWHELHPDFAACAAEGQSPIDLGGAHTVELPQLAIEFPALEVTAVHAGTTLRVDAPPGQTLRIGDRTLALEQIHLHAPSEHLLQGQAFPMEVHFVHRDGEGLFVIGVLVEAGAPHPGYTPLFDALAAGLDRDGATATVGIDLEALLPEQLDQYYWYWGSLTTPPCTLGVGWIVLATPIALSPRQIGQFTDAFSPNARPVQPSGAHTVHRSF